MAANSGDSTCVLWEDFLSLHQPQLQSVGLPQNLWKRLYQKIYSFADHDNKEFFEVRRCDLQDEKRKFSLHAKRNVEKMGDVFIVSHIWTSDGNKEAKQQLIKTPNLLKKVQEIMTCFEDEMNKNSESDLCDNVKILMDLGHVKENRAKELLKSFDNELINALMYSDPEGPKPKENKKSSKSILTFEEFKLGFMSQVGEERKELLSDDYVRKMYTRYRKDKEQEKDDFLGKGVTAHYSWNEEDDGSINVLISVPSGVKKNQIFNKITMKKWVFGLKGSTDKIIDGELHDGVVAEECFWTFDSPGVVQMTLQKVDADSRLWPVLIKNEKQLDDKQIYQQARKRDDEMYFQIDEVLDNMWFYNQTYEAFYPQAGTKKRLWYVMDEIGSAIIHSNEPNLQCAPFANAITGVFYSVIWPLSDIKQGELCTRNFCLPLSPTETSLQKEARLLGCHGEMPEHCPSLFYVEQLGELSCKTKPDDLVINISCLSDGTTRSDFPNMKVAKKVYTDVKSGYGMEALVSLGCEIVTSPQEADAFWLSSAVSFSNLKPNQKVNRLMGEQYLLSPSLLSKQVVSSCGKVAWFPTAFNLRSELALVCADHYQNIGRYWIVRSADQARTSFAPIITSNLQRVIRLAEPESLVASHFVPSTLLYKKRHFCLQYAVAVSSLHPLELFVHNSPNVRLAAREVDAHSFEIDEYNGSSLITVSQELNTDKQVSFEDLLNDIKAIYLKQAPKSWEVIQKAVYQCFATVFSSALSHLSASGMCAVYGVDVLIKGDLSPLIIGIDRLPTFPSKNIATEIMLLALGTCDEERKFATSNCFTKITVSGVGKESI